MSKKKEQDFGPIVYPSSAINNNIKDQLLTMEISNVQSQVPQQISTTSINQLYTTNTFVQTEQLLLDVLASNDEMDKITDDQKLQAVDSGFSKLLLMIDYLLTDPQNVSIVISSISIFKSEIETLTISPNVLIKINTYLDQMQKKVQLFSNPTLLSAPYLSAPSLSVQPVQPVQTLVQPVIPDADEDVRVEFVKDIVLQPDEEKMLHNFMKALKDQNTNHDQLRSIYDYLKKLAPNMYVDKLTFLFKYNLELIHDANKTDNMQHLSEIIDFIKKEESSEYLIPAETYIQLKKQKLVEHMQGDIPENVVEKKDGWKFMPFSIPNPFSSVFQLLPRKEHQQATNLLENDYELMRGYLKDLTPSKRTEIVLSLPNDKLLVLGSINNEKIKNMHLSLEYENEAKRITNLARNVFDLRTKKNNENETSLTSSQFHSMTSVNEEPEKIVDAIPVEPYNPVEPYIMPEEKIDDVDAQKQLIRLSGIKYAPDRLREMRDLEKPMEKAIGNITDEWVDKYYDTDEEKAFIAKSVISMIRLKNERVEIPAVGEAPITHHISQIVTQATTINIDLSEVTEQMPMSLYKLLPLLSGDRKNIFILVYDPSKKDVWKQFENNIMIEFKGQFGKLADWGASDILNHEKYNSMDYDFEMAHNRIKSAIDDRRNYHQEKKTNPRHLAPAKKYVKSIAFARESSIKLLAESNIVVLPVFSTIGNKNNENSCVHYVNAWKDVLRDIYGQTFSDDFNFDGLKGSGINGNIDISQMIGPEITKLLLTHPSNI